MRGERNLADSADGVAAVEGVDAAAVDADADAVAVVAVVGAVVNGKSEGVVWTSRTLR